MVRCRVTITMKILRPDSAQLPKSRCASHGSVRRFEDCPSVGVISRLLCSGLDQIRRWEGEERVCDDECTSDPRSGRLGSHGWPNVASCSSVRFPQWRWTKRLCIFLPVSSFGFPDASELI